MAADRHGVFDRHVAGQNVRAQRILAADDAVLQIDQQTCGRGVLEGVAVEGHARRGGQLDIHAEVIQGHCIVAGLGLLRLLAVAAVIILAFDRSCERLELDVAEVGATRSVEVGLRESPDFLVKVHVAGTVGPGAVTGIGAGLHQSEREAGTGEGVAVVGRADKGVHVLREIPLRTTEGAGASGDQRQKQKTSDFFHNAGLSV